MKYNKFFRILSVAVVLALLLMLIPASLVLAASVILDPEEGAVGDRIDIDGWGFPASWYDQATGTYYDYYVDIYFSSDDVVVGKRIDTDVTAYEFRKTVWVNEAGRFNTSFTVPARLTDGDDVEDVHGGTYYVYVTYEGSKIIRAKADFTVIAGEIAIDPIKGVVGTEVEITGTDFAGREVITVEYDGLVVDIASGDEKTGSNGEFSATILIPESTAGDHTITVTDESGSSDEAVFTVEPEITTIKPTSGAAGDSVTVNGTGFSGRVDITITFGAIKVATGSTDRDGSFEADFTVPAIAPGTYTVKIEDEDGNLGTAEFTIAASFSISKTTGNVGTEITVSGTGFIPNTPVTITYDTEPIVVATTTTDANGSFSATFKVPASRHGDHIITATDGVNTLAVTFTMESTPPPIPAPLLPEMGVKAEQPVYFDWKDVTDPSGLTYTLQVAKDKDFTTIVLEKEGLTQSEYTMTEEEELESTKKEAPYWWRVKAIDGASNESKWSGAGSFHVGFVFAMPAWAKYLLWALGGLVLFFLGFWLGRRIAYASY